MIYWPLRLLGKCIYKLRGYREIDAKDDPRLMPLRVALRNRRFDQIAEHLQSVKNSDSHEWSLAGLTSWKGRPAFLDTWVNAQPNCGDAYLVCGAHSLSWAWEARTGARAESVKENAWSTFHERLVLAEDDLRKAAKLMPSDAAPYTQLIHCAIGKQHPQEHVNKLYKAAVARFPESWNTHYFALTYLCRKWMGSHEKMFGFARNTLNRATPGSSLGALTAVAHIERYLYAASFDQDTAFAESYWEQPGVRSELAAAFSQSLGASQYQATEITPWLRNYFACALSLANLKYLAKPLFESIDRTHTAFPWIYFGAPTATYLELKLKATRDS